VLLVKRPGTRQAYDLGWTPVGHGAHISKSTARSGSTGSNPLDA
jgi:hypothetical protein